MPLKRGDVALAVFPNTDGLTAKLRPVIIIQADGLDTGLPQVLVAMVTSNLRRSGKPFRVFVALDSAEGRESGLLSNLWSWPIAWRRLPQRPCIASSDA